MFSEAVYPLYLIWKYREVHVIVTFGEEDFSNSVISNSPLSRTRTHSPCFSVIYYCLSRTPCYLELKPIPLVFQSFKPIPIPLALVYQSFTIGYLEPPASLNRFLFPLECRDSGIQL